MCKDAEDCDRNGTTAPRLGMEIIQMAMCTAPTSHHNEIISKTNEQVSKHHNHYDGMITESDKKKENSEDPMGKIHTHTHTHIK